MGYNERDSINPPFIPKDNDCYMKKELTFTDAYKQAKEPVLIPNCTNDELRSKYQLAKAIIETTIGDSVNNPTHYKLNEHGIECIEAIKASMSKEEWEGYCKGNCEKYIWRYNYKGKPVEDLKKAEYYLKALIKSVEGTK
jgi:hypothetical protein